MASYFLQSFFKEIFYCKPYEKGFQLLIYEYVPSPCFC